MSSFILPEQSIIVEHSAGGLEEECGKEYIRLLLPIFYNIIYGDIMRDPMYNNVSGNIHGSVVLQVLKNSPVMLNDYLTSIEWEDSILEIEGLKHEHKKDDEVGNCLACLAVNNKSDLILEMAEALLETMPYLPALRQHMAVKGNSLSVVYEDGWTLLVRAHGVESNAPLERDVIYDSSVITGLVGRSNG